ncbi:MAG: YgiQ family radical SAM protein [Gammaproteobacteria bacterium]|nr:YgiQ family radical SAM protein [Gammaproteobacteria bacterium]
MGESAKHLFSYPPYWAECYGTAPYLPMSRAEMDALGWDSCDIIIVTGDAYVDHPSFGMAVVGRLLEAQGFRVGIISQPDWHDTTDFMRLGAPNLFFGVTAGNMDSMINRYTADLRMRSDDAYTPGDVGGKRPDRSVIVYSQRCREAYRDVPIVIGGIEASLRRIAQYDYWSDQVRKSVLVDSDADILLYGNAERAVAEIAHGLARGWPLSDMTQIRGTAVLLREAPGDQEWIELDSSRVDWPGKIDEMQNPYDFGGHEDGQGGTCKTGAGGSVQVVPMPLRKRMRKDPRPTYVRLPSFEKVRNDRVLYAHASRVLHLESNPGNARPLIQRHGKQEVWINPPPIPLTTEELDGVFDLPYQRTPHPSYGDAKIPAYEMIRFSVNIMRGCFGGCTFCSITEHEGRIIQSRSEGSILREIEDIRDKVPGFTGTISDLGGPTANMYRLNCKDKEVEANCRRLSCVYPGICRNLNTDHSATTQLYRKARAIKGVKRVAIGSGLRYDLAVEDPEYVRELVTHHVGGYLKIAPEHTEDGVLAKMMKPGIGTFERFRAMFERFSREAGKEQYLIPYFIAAHPGSRDEDMIAVARWLKRNDLRVDQVQTFYPSPMAMATAMYYSERDPLHKVSYKSEPVFIPRDLAQRRLQKALLRYHDPAHADRIRETLIAMGRRDLIGSGDGCLVPEAQARSSAKPGGAGGRRGTPKSGPRTGAKPGRGGRRRR